MWETNATVTICDDYQSAQHAVKALGKSGRNLKRLSVLGRDCYSADHPSAEVMGDELRKRCARSVSFWCKMWSTLSGEAFLNLTGIGSVLVVGPLAPELISRWADPEIDEGQDLLSAGLRDLGVPQESIAACETALRSDRYLVILSGNHAEGEQGKGSLHSPAAVRTLKNAALCDNSDEEHLVPA